MAEEEEPVGEEPEEEQAKTKEARQLDSLTDHVSERELSGDRVKARQPPAPRRATPAAPPPAFSPGAR